MKRRSQRMKCFKITKTTYFQELKFELEAEKEERHLVA